MSTSKSGISRRKLLEKVAGQRPLMLHISGDMAMQPTPKLMMAKSVVLDYADAVIDGNPGEKEDSS